MNEQFRRNFWIIAGIHCGIILVLLISSLVMHWRRPKKKDHEIVAIVDLQTAVAEAPNLVPVDKIVPPPPAPEKPKDIPVPAVKPKPKPKPRPKIEPNKQRIRRQDDTPPKPRMNEEEIRKLLDAGKSKPGPRATTSVPFAWYYTLVRQAMYESWDQPSGLAASGLRSQVTIRVMRDGAITSRTLSQPSGNPLMDESVMKAVRSVSRLKPLPEGFGGTYKDITIEFELTSAL